MKVGYHCEECEEAVWLEVPRAELVWLRDRIHVAREVARHAHSGLDSWIVEGMTFLERHNAHSVQVTTKRG